MKIIHVLVLFILMAPLSSLASDTTNIPVTRQVFHENIIEEQRLADKMDGRLDGMIKVGNNEEVNLQVSDAFSEE